MVRALGKTWILNKVFNKDTDTLKVALYGQNGPVDLNSTINEDGVNLSKTYMEYTTAPYNVLNIQKNIAYASGLGTNSTKLYKSEDNGLTWVQKWDNAQPIRAAIITANNTVIIWTDDKVYRSTDDTTFTKVLENIIRPFSSASIATSVNTVCFGEYVLTNGLPVRIWTSTNDGETWTATLTDGNSDSATSRHFHTCQYFGRIGNMGTYIATTGDNTMHWYVSTDAVTWTKILTTTDQRYRTCALVFLNSEEIAWSSDGTYGAEGVYKTKIVNRRISGLEKLVTLAHTSYGIAGRGQTLVATTRPTTAYLKDRKSYVYISKDAGKTWQIDRAYQTNTLDAGFSSIMGPDDKGNYYGVITGVEGIIDSSTILMRPLFNNERVRINESIIKTKSAESNQINILPRSIRTTHANEQVTVPDGARGCVVMCRIYAVTGTEPTCVFSSDQQGSPSQFSGPRLSSPSQTSTANMAHWWVPGATKGDADSRITDIKISGLFGQPVMSIGLAITGTFGEGQGIDSQIDVLWLF
jgi:hypothetical protein